MQIAESPDEVTPQSPARRQARLWFYCFFLVSGFCSILYELVWLRLAMAQFAVTTAFVSIVLSVFMAGLGIGSWAAGRYTEGRHSPAGISGLKLYGVAELLIGVSALLVPYELSWGRALLGQLQANATLPPWAYYPSCGIWIAIALAPWCACMGATFPLAMLALRQRVSTESPRSFSYLYLANLGGASIGTIVPLLLIEELGFRGTLRIGFLLNLCLAVCAFSLARRHPVTRPLASPAGTPSTPPSKNAAPRNGKLLWLLFATGLASMAVEVVWVRLYTPFLGTVVYAFAAILFSYLAATCCGSLIYRKTRITGEPSWGFLMVLLGFCTVLPLIVCDPRLEFAGPLPKMLRLLIGVAPLSAMGGYLTPMLMDRVSGGDPGIAGRAYAVNIAGCVLGPLLSGFILLPSIGEAASLFLFALAWLAIGLISTPRLSYAKTGPLATATLAVIVYVGFFAPKDVIAKVLRDNTATVRAFGTGMDKHLQVNGVGITKLTPITKLMAHLPLAFLGRPPQNALVICFGMGTTHRSMLSWGIHSTAVELVPSVPALFWFFHADGARLLQSPLSRVVIDDGRSFLQRSEEQFDVIALDPPPPVEAAASSLLYSKEFYAAVIPRLRPGGILQQWLPVADPQTRASVARALKESFPYVRTFGSVEGWGFHFLASLSPIPSTPAAVLASRMPPSAVVDLLEWGPESAADRQFASVLRDEVSLDSLIREDATVPPLQDDRPINEYYLLRRLGNPEPTE
jgi:predicted membrane-bound spermidine synthase